MNRRSRAVTAMTVLATGGALWAAVGVPVTASAAPAPECGGRPATIIGKDGDDVLVGTPGDDVAFLDRGSDRFDGLGGNDVVCGGPGNDVIVGGDGDDVVNGGDGDDWIDGGAGDDRISVLAGSDGVLAGDGADTITVRVPVADVHAGAGNDVVLRRLAHHPAADERGRRHRGLPHHLRRGARRQGRGRLRRRRSEEHTSELQSH